MSELSGKEKLILEYQAIAWSVSQQAELLNNAATVVIKHLTSTTDHRSEILVKAECLQGAAEVKITK